MNQELESDGVRIMAEKILPTETDRVEEDRVRRRLP